MNNLEILKKIKKIYNPKTAFGNGKILNLLNQVSIQDDDGLFEAEGRIQEIRVAKIRWECANCGRDNLNEIEHLNDYDITEKCELCGSLSKIYV